MYDLCVSVDSQSQVAREVYQVLERLGYSGAALEYTTSFPLRPKDACKRSPQPSTSSASPDLVSAASVVLARGRSGAMLSKRDARRLAAKASAFSAGASQAGQKRPREESGASRSSSSSSSSSTAPAFREYRRITITLDPSCSGGSGGGGGGGGFTSTRTLAQELKEGAGVLSTYDLVAVQPSDAAGMNAIAAAGSGTLVDIVTLDMSSGRLAFPLSSRDISGVLAAGLVIELRYAPAIRDAALRRAFLTHAATLLRVTRGTGLILTSGARSALEIRCPRAVASIASLAGFSLQQANIALTAAPAAALAHAGRRKG
jgi:RNase P/RNase MRP subunit p30